ncbi:hypothetical protein GOODEAATRI_007052 [Goodea atripinnis]|uniref:Uncharacterized protein n=1 Tax=Goodea atripinnis TaxID=208336 RepID=A0ABV0PC33_9TELE
MTSAHSYLLYLLLFLSVSLFSLCPAVFVHNRTHKVGFGKCDACRNISKSESDFLNVQHEVEAISKLRVGMEGLSNANSLFFAGQHPAIVELLGEWWPSG